MNDTGRLVQKPQDEIHSNQIYNYALLLKKQMDNSALQICEFISLRHDTLGKIEFLSRFRCELRKQFGEIKMTELVVTDYLCMEHSIIERTWEILHIEFFSMRGLANTTIKNHF